MDAQMLAAEQEAQREIKAAEQEAQREIKAAEQEAQRESDAQNERSINWTTEQFMKILRGRSLYTKPSLRKFESRVLEDFKAGKSGITDLLIAPAPGEDQEPSTEQMDTLRRQVNGLTLSVLKCLIVQQAKREKKPLRGLHHDVSVGSTWRNRGPDGKVEQTHADLTSLSVPKYQTYTNGHIKHDRYLGRPMEMPARKIFDGLNSGPFGRNDRTKPPRKKPKVAPQEKAERPVEEDGVDQDEEDGVDEAAPQEFVGSSSSAVFGL